MSYCFIAICMTIHSNLYISKYVANVTRKILLIDSDFEIYLGLYFSS